MTITDNVIEDEVVSSAEKDVARIRRKSGEDFRLLFQEGKDEIELDKINKFFNEADQPFIEQFVHDVNQGVQNHFNQGEEDVQNRNHWKRALPILENFKKHQAKRGAKRDFGVLEGIRNTEINSNWRDRKKSYYLPVFKGEKPVDGVEDKYQDRAMNAMFIAEANELDLEQVNGSYELYRAQLWAGYKLEGKPNDKGLRERIKQDLVKEDDRQNFIKEIANDAHNSAMLGMPMNWTGRQEFTFDDSDYEKYGVSKDHAKKIFRSVARNSVRDFKVAAPYGVKLADAISKRMGVDLKYDNNSDKSSDSLDVLISEIATLPKEERGRVLYVASKVAEKEGISTDSYLESLGLTMKRHFQDYPNTVVAGFVKKTGDDPDEDANTFAKIEKLKEEHFEKFGYDFIEKNKDKPANDKEVQAYFKSQDKFRKAESALTSANRRELWHDIRDVRNTIRKVELQYEEGLMRDVQQGTLDATSSILPMAAIALPFGLGYATNALYYSEEDDHLMRHEYPEMDANTREVIAGFSGSAKTLTNRIAVGKIFSKAPFTASLMKKIGARGAIASLLGRGLKGGAWEYTEERLQEAILPLAHEIGAALSKDIPELKEDSWDKVIYGTNEDGSLREKTKLNAIYHPRIFFAVLPLVTLASGGSTVIDKMGADKFRKSLSSEDQLMLVGLTLEEAQVIQGMNESGSINVHTEFQKMMQDKTPEQKKEAIKAAEDSGALDRVRESEVMDNGTDAEKKAFSEAKQAFEKLTEIQKRVNGEVRTMDDGRVEVVFPESLNKVNEYYDNTDQAQEAYISAIEDHDAQQSAEIKSTQGSIEELRGRGIKDASDAKKAVAGFLGKAHEGAENQFVDSDYGMQQKLDKAEIDFEEAMDALKVANMHNKSGVPITLQNAMIKGENVHKKNARGYINKLYRGADVSTVFHESAEGYLKSLIENDGYTYKWFADQMADYQRATGDIIFADIDNFTNREVIEGWSKLSEAHVYNNMESSSFPPFIRAILNAFKKYFAHTVDTAKNLLQLKQDGKLDGDFESHLDKAVGLDSESIKGNKQKQYEREIVEEILDASGDFVPDDSTPFSVGDTSFSVDYMRVLPRDFFNEAKVYSMHTKLVEDFNNGKLPKGFDIEVIDENDKIGLSDDGELYFNGIEITFDGEPLQFNTTYNAGKTAKYPLSVTAEGMDIWSVPVYDQDGNLDEEFTDAFGEELGDSNDVMLDGTMEVNRDFLVQMGRLGLLYVAGMLSNDFKLDLVDLEAGMQLEEDGNSVYSTNIESSIKGEPIEFNKSFNGELRYDHNGESGNVFDGSGLSDDFSKIVSRNGDTSFSIRPLSPRELTTQVTSLENTFRSYDEVQNEIDSVEDELELQGVDTSKMYNPSDPEAETIRGTLPDYQPMPDRLAKLYEERESIGATEFETGREALSSNLASLGLTVGEVRKVLQYYSVDPDKSGAVEQSMSASSTMGTIRKKTQEQQAEEIAYTLANARNESFDGLRDISKKTLKDAAKVVQLTKQFLDPETSPVAPEVTLAREPKADTSGDTSFSISPAQVEAEILDTLPDDTYLTRFGGGVGRSSVNIDEVTLYKGEDSPPKIKKATLDGGDSSMISNSTYPIIRLDMSNGSYFKQQIRISDHAQVSKNAPKNYDYDYRGKNWTAVKSSVLEDMEVLSSEIWDAQKTILTTEKSVRDNDRELQDKKGSQAAQVRQKTELERLISNLESVSNPSRSEKLEKAIERGDKIAEAGHRNAISKNNLRIKESKEKLIQLADIEASGDTSFSISPADVTAHSKAYEDGDTDTAQRLVDAAAKAAGYEVDAYHVTDEKFDVFDPYESAMGGVFWFTENKSKIEDGGTGAGLNPTKEQLTLHVYLKANKQAGWDEYDKLGLGEIEAKGFDSVKLDDDYIVFNSSQIKLADPFTYDANGDLIPLSERFNESKDEISFSVSPADVIFNPDKTSELQALKILETEILKYKVYEVSDNTESQKETVLVTTDLNKAYDELEDIGFKNEFDTRELMSSVVYDSKKAASDLYSEFKDFGSDITREDIYNEIEDQEIDLDFEKVIENINYKEENEEALMLQSKISENLKEEFGLPFGKYTDVKINGDTGVFSVRMADHSQRFANIRTNYSISLVIADKDATANNYGSNGFERKEIEAGEGNHAQIYINTDLTEKQAIEYAVSEVKEQIEFAKNEISFSLSETNIADPLIEKIQKLIRDPETKATVFKVMAMRMDKLKAKQNAKLTQRLFDGDGELSTNEELIDSLAQLDAIRAVLPKEIRGLIGGDKNLAELKTVKGRTNYLIRRMNRVDDVLESYMVKSYKESINKLFQRSKPKSKNKASDSGQSKIGSAGHLIAEAAEAASMMSPDAAELEAAKIRREIDKPEPEEEQVIQDRAYVTEMFADMGNADSHRLEQMLGILQANWDEGRAEWVKVLSDRKEWRENIIEKARKAFGVTKRNDSETTSKTGKTDAKWKQYAKEGLTFYHLTDLLKEGDTDEAASVWKELEDDFRRAENMNEDLNFKHKEEMKAVMSDIFGFTRNKQAQIQGRLRTLSKQVRQTKLTKTQEYELEIAANQVDLDQAEKAFDADQEITIRGVVISKKEFAELQIGWKDAVSMGFDPEARKLFRYSIVRNEGERTSVGEMSQLDMLKDYLCIQQKDLKAKYEKTGHDQQYRMELEEALDEDTKELGLWMQNKLKDDQDIEQALHRQEYGLAMKLINNYFPAIFEHGGKQSGTVLTMDGVEIGQSSKRPSSHKLRVNHNSRPKKQNALSVYNGNVMQRNFWQTHAEVMRKWAGVIRDKNTQDYILRSKGQTTLNLLNRWLNDTENQGADIAKAQIETDNLWRSLGQGMALGILGGRITTILKNVIASSNVALGTNFKDLMRGISPEIKGDVKELYESPTFQRRLKIGSTVANRYALESSPSGHLYTSTLKRAAEYPTQAINLADTLSNLTFALAYRAKIKNLQIETRGMTEADAKEKALDYVDSLVARYAQPTGRLSKSLWENTRGPEAMFLVKFMSEARKVIAINMLAIRKLSTGKGVGNKGDAGRQLLITIIVNSLFVHVINSLCSAFVKGEGEGEEPEDEFINRLTDGKSIAAAMMTESFSGVPIVSDGYRYAVNTTLGVKAYDSSSNPTMKIAKAGSTALSLLTDDKERTASEMADSIMRVVQGFGSITPYTAVFSQAANVGRDGLGFYNNTLGKGLNEEDTKQLSIDRISKKKKYIYGLDSELYTAGTKREKKQITETRHDALEVYLLDYLMDLPDNRRKLVIDELNDEKEIDKDVMKRVEKEIYSQ